MGLRDSFWSLLGKGQTDAPEIVLERVRAAMQALIQAVGTDRHIRLDVKVQLARDLSELWYLRPDVMQMVAESQGEEAAKACLARLTHLFEKYHLAGTAKSR